MCGRFSLAASPDDLAVMFGISDVPSFDPRYNIAPTQPVITVRIPPGMPKRARAWASVRWGLVPPFADDPAIGASMINARSETLASKPAFRAAMKYRRCLVPATGFFEWEAVGKVKQPYFFQMLDKSPFAMAGLWEIWKGPDGAELETCTILTTTANELSAKLHDRMPVIVRPEDFARWLDPNVRQYEAIEDLLVPFPAEAMTAYTVNPVVNNARHEGEKCIEPFKQHKLFD